MRKLRVAVLMGGPSVEHDVSLASGKMILSALNRDKYEAAPILISRAGKWEIVPEELKEKFDLAFIALHGEYGEDGEVQSILERVEMPYTGSGVLPSALAMNKVLTSRLLRAHGFNVPDFVEVSKHDNLAKLHIPFDFPVVVKPVDRGSSLGVTIVGRGSELMPALEHSFDFSRHAMVEKYIPGRELTCSVIENSEGGAEPLPVTEIIPKISNFFDYHAKYTPKASEEITPARLPVDWNTAVQDVAKRAHEIIGAAGMSRTDFILDHSGALYILEINTVPGMTQTSLLPQAAFAAGLTFTELLDRIINSAFRKYGITGGRD
jgi:D-alanine-D-alanine ligase